MSEAQCPSCLRPKATLACDLCQGPVCKDCVQPLAEDAFRMRGEVPSELKHLRYCQACFDSTVAPELEIYRETLERAKQVFFFFDTQKARLPILERARETVKVSEQTDRDETILMLAYRAASLGFNAIVDGNVECEKVRNYGWQKMKWRGRGVPARVDAVKLERDYE